MVVVFCVAIEIESIFERAFDDDATKKDDDEIDRIRDEEDEDDDDDVDDCDDFDRRVNASRTRMDEDGPPPPKRVVSVVSVVSVVVFRRGKDAERARVANVLLENRFR